MWNLIAFVLVVHLLSYNQLENFASFFRTKNSDCKKQYAKILRKRYSSVFACSVALSCL
jgi:hypothetical protein